MTEFFDVAVYHPLLELHETEPDHNIWQLEETITSLRLKLGDMVRSARIADAAASGVVESFHAATTTYDREMMHYGIEAWHRSLPSEETLVNVDSESSFTSLEQIDEEPAEHEDSTTHNSLQMAVRSRPCPIVGPSTSVSPEDGRESLDEEDIESIRQRLITAFISRLGCDCQPPPSLATPPRSKTHSPSKSMPTTSTPTIVAVRQREYTL